MPRQKLTIPAYTHHKPTGQARVRINGRDHYLGSYGSDESRIAYGNLIAGISGGQSVDPFASGTNNDDPGCTVAELLQAFKAYAETYYIKNGKKTSECDCFYSAMRPVRQLYALHFAKDFGPLHLKAARQKYIDAGWTRKFCNKSTNRIRQIWKWGVSNGLVPVATWQALTSVEPLKIGRTMAPDRPDREAIEESRLLAAREKLSSNEQDFFDLLRWSGARPSELIGLSLTDIDKSGPVWTVKLVDHKCVHLGKSRKLYFGPKCQQVLKRCRQTGPMFTFHRGTFSDNLKAACVEAGVEPFVPYALRHTAATAARDTIGLEASQGLLGHSKPDMTTKYTKKLDQLAVKVASMIG